MIKRFVEGCIPKTVSAEALVSNYNSRKIGEEGFAASKNSSQRTCFNKTYISI